MPASKNSEDRVLYTNFHHISTNADAAISILMLSLAKAINSSISAFSLCVTHSLASRPLLPFKDTSYHLPWVIQDKYWDWLLLPWLWPLESKQLFLGPVDMVYICLSSTETIFINKILVDLSFIVFCTGLTTECSCT